MLPGRSLSTGSGILTTEQAREREREREREVEEQGKEGGREIARQEETDGGGREREGERKRERVKDKGSLRGSERASPGKQLAEASWFRFDSSEDLATASPSAWEVCEFDGACTIYLCGTYFQHFDPSNLLYFQLHLRFRVTFERDLSICRFVHSHLFVQFPLRLAPKVTLYR